jgi:hypothetical protein
MSVFNIDINLQKKLEIKRKNGAEGPKRGEAGKGPLIEESLEWKNDLGRKPNQNTRRPDST